jgi:hypothetical protein
MNVWVSAPLYWQSTYPQAARIIPTVETSVPYVYTPHLYTGHPNYPDCREIYMYTLLQWKICPQFTQIIQNTETSIYIKSSTLVLLSIGYSNYPDYSDIYEYSILCYNGTSVQRPKNHSDSRDIHILYTQLHGTSVHSSLNLSRLKWLPYSATLGDLSAIHSYYPDYIHWLPYSATLGNLSTANSIPQLHRHLTLLHRQICLQFTQIIPTSEPSVFHYTGTTVH